MSNMQSEVYEAFRSLDVPEEKAMRAATALSQRDVDVAGLKADVGTVKGDVAGLKVDVSALKSDVRLLTWMVGTLYPLVIAILLKLFIH